MRPLPPINPATRLDALPPDWWIEVDCACVNDPPTCLPLAGLRTRTPAATLGSIADRLKCVRCGGRASSVVLTDQQTRRWARDSFPPQTVRVVLR